MEKTQVVKKDFLVLVFDVKTGKVSTDGGNFRQLKFAAPRPERPTAPGKPEGTPPGKPPEGTPPSHPPEEPPPPAGPFDDYICARISGEPPSACRIFLRSNGVFYDLGVDCTDHPVCYVL